MEWLFSGVFMTYAYTRSYRGRLQGVILDWAGTTIDYGCFAPLMVFIEIFKNKGIDISIDEARGPMGTHKRDHIEQILMLPNVQKKWQQSFKRASTKDDIDELFTDFVPMQLGCLQKHSKIIPGVKEAIDHFRERKLKIGSTTGFTRQMMEVVWPLAKAQGYAPDALVCANDVPMARPAPWMCFQNAQELGIFPMESLVKIGDTPVDILEGLNASMWSVGIAKTGNELGLSEEAFNELSKNEQEQKLARARQSLYQAGAHYVVDHLSDVPAILDQIEQRVFRGEKP